MPAIYASAGGAPAFVTGTHTDQVGVNDSPANAKGYEFVGAPGMANFYVAQTSANINALNVYNHQLATNRDYAGGDTVRSHRIACLVQTDVDNNDPTIPSRVDIYGWNFCSVINVGRNGPSYGSSLAYSALVDVFTESSGNETCLYHGSLVAGTSDLHVAAGGNYWMTDLSVYGPVGVQPGYLVGLSTQIANFYNGSPSAGASIGCRVMNAMDGPGASNKRHVGNVTAGALATSYPVDIGVGVGGAANGGTGDSFTNAIQVGGTGVIAPYTPVTMGGDQGQVGRGVVVKARNAGTSCARLGAFVSEGTGEAGGLILGLDTSDATRVTLYRPSAGNATLNGNLTITGAISAGSGLGSGGGSPGGTSGQIEWNNAGAFAGFTMGGDATLNTATGALTIASGAITPAKQANMSALTLRGNPTGSPASPAEVTLGPALAFSGTTLRNRVPLVWVIAPGTAVANSAALTSLFTGATLGGSLTLPANTLIVRSMLRFELFGVFGCTSSTPTFTMQYLLGGTIIAQGTGTLAAAAISANAFTTSPTGGPGCQVQVVGSAGKIIGGGYTTLLGGVSVALNPTGAANAPPAQISIDTTVSLALDVKVQWGTAAAANTIQLLGGAIFLDG